MALLRNITAILLCAFLIVGGHEAYAQTSRIYFAGYLGLTSYTDRSFEESSTSTSGDLTVDNSVSFAGALGLRINKQLRAELEAGYTKANLDEFEINNGNVAAGGELGTRLLMLNAYYDFDLQGWPVTPFLSAGAGVAWQEVEIANSGGALTTASDSTFGLAWSLGGGMKYRVSPDLAFTGGYRFLSTTDLEIDTYDIDFNAHELRVGLEYDIPVRSY